jgi:hypothetical protein
MISNAHEANDNQTAFGGKMDLHNNRIGQVNRRTRRHPPRAKLWPANAMGIARLRVATFLVAALLLGCTPGGEDPDLARQISEAVGAVGVGNTVDLADLLDAPDERIAAFHGYASHDEVSAAIGVDWLSGEESLVPYDGDVLVVAVRDGAVERWAILNRDGSIPLVRFNEYGRLWGADDLRFRVSVFEHTADGLPIHRLDPIADDAN